VKRTELARYQGAFGPFRKYLGSKKLANGGLAHAKMRRDCLVGVPLLMEAVDLVVAGLSCRSMLLDLLLGRVQQGGLGWLWWGSFGRARGGVFLPGGFSQSRLVLVEEVFQSVAEIAQKVPSICYLLGVWSPVSGALSVSLRTVAANHLDAGMGFEPVRQALCRPIGQEVDDDMALKIIKDRAVVVAPAQREIIHSQSRGSGCDRVGSGAHQPQQGHTTGMQAKPLGEAAAGATALCHSDVG
jgi:hypothetical protein